MFGLNEIKETFGTMSVAVLIEVIVAIIGIWIAYKKLKDKIIGSYEERKQQREDIDEALEGVRNMPKYRKQSIEIQNELKRNDESILDTCKKIQAGVDRNQEILNERLDKLEERERNSLRAKILEMHRTFTSSRMNPMQAWSEMERDAFNDLIMDYESLNGNGHVHSVVIPEMNRLRVILMTDTQALADLFHSRNA